MISRLITPRFRTARVCRWMVVPLMVIMLALATTVSIQSDTAYADTGAGAETISAPMGNPKDCWWVGVVCLLL